MVKYSNGTTYTKATQKFWDFTRNESLNTSVIPSNRRNSYSGESVILSHAASLSRPGTYVSYKMYHISESVCSSQTRTKIIIAHNTGMITICSNDRLYEMPCDAM